MSKRKGDLSSSGLGPGDGEEFPARTGRLRSGASFPVDVMEYRRARLTEVIEKADKRKRKGKSDVDK